MKKFTVVLFLIIFIICALVSFSTFMSKDGDIGGLYLGMLFCLPIGFFGNMLKEK